MLATLITAVISGEAAQVIERARRKAVAYAVAALLALCGCVFVLVAGYIAAAREIGPIAAAIWFAVAFFALAILVIAVHGVMARIRARRVARRRETEVKAVASTAVLTALPSLLAGRGRAAAILIPALAALGYAGYREYRRRNRDSLRD